jgi:hypothetical protein
MDKIVLAKWFVCVATLVVVVLLAVSLDKLNKKNKKTTSGGRGNGSQVKRIGRGGRGGRDQPLYQAGSCVPWPIDDGKGPPNCMPSSGVGSPCCCQSECDENAPTRDPNCSGGQAGRFNLQSAVVNGNLACFAKGASDCAMACEEACAEQGQPCIDPCVASYC